MYGTVTEASESGLRRTGLRPAAKLWNVASSFAPVVVLALGTYLYLGYRYGIPGQTSQLEYILRYHGELSSDWGTSYPSAHWTYTHLLALFPIGWLETVYLVGWVLYLTILWTAICSIAWSLRIPTWATLGAGTLLIVTRLDALGWSSVLMGFLYPTGLAFAFAIGGVAALLRERLLVAASLLGVATLIHPAIGLLIAIALTPTVLLLERGPRTLAAMTGIFLVLGGYSLFHLIAHQSGTGELPPQRAYEVLAEVRIPHHLLYARFGRGEYAQTLAWICLLALGAWATWSDKRVRILTSLAVTVAGLCTIGAIASIMGGPQALVQVQTARLTPLFVILGVLTGAAAMTRVDPRIASVGMAGAALASAWIAVLALASSPAGSVVGAGCVILVLAASLLIRRGWSLTVSPRFASVSTALLLGITFLVLSRAGAPASSPAELAYRDVAEAARRLTSEDSLFMTPPDQSGFRFYAHRAVVIDFGVFRFGKGDAEWVERVEDLTQDPRVLDPDFSDSVLPRLTLMAHSYDEIVQTSPDPVCEYGVDYVVAKPGLSPPHLEPLYANDHYALYEVQPSTCSGTA